MNNNQDLQELEIKAADLGKRLWELAAPAKDKQALPLDSLIEIDRLSVDLRDTIQKILNNTKKTTLVISAPYSRGKPGTPNSFETYFQTGVGKGYIIHSTEIGKLGPGSTVVLLRQDKLKQRAEGILVKLVATSKTPKGNQRYDVYFKDQGMVTFKGEKLNPFDFGVAVID